MATGNPPSELLAGLRIVFVGKLASMSRREAVQLVRRHGATVLENLSPSAQLIVIGEEGLPVPDTDLLDEWFDDACRAAVEQGTLEVVSETQLWQRLGLVAAQPDIHRLYTPAMLAQLLGVSVAVIRRWHRRGLIVPALEVRRLLYFDIQEVAAARRMAQLLAAGMSPQKIEKKLAALAQLLPDVARPLAQLSIIVEGKEILLRQGDGLLELGGQYRFDFEAGPPRPAPAPSAVERTPGYGPGEDVAAAALAEPDTVPVSSEELCREAAELEEDGQLAVAADLYRAAMAAGGPTAEICFQLAELLYRLGDLPAARERYFMAIELDEDYVEARANLGCLLAECGQAELAIAAFEGALRFHGGYADAHYHLARILDDVGRHEEALVHWRTFLAMAPESPWAAEAQQRLT